MENSRARTRISNESENGGSVDVCGSGTRGGWREALRQLKAALVSAPSGELGEAKMELTAVLTSVAERCCAVGNDPLLEAMHATASRAIASRHSLETISRIVQGMTAKLRLGVDAADPANLRFSASVQGEWGVHGKTYKFSAAVTEEDSRVVSGSIDVGGLNFSARGDLSEGSIASDGEAAVWAATAGVEVPLDDVARIVVVSLEVLAKRRVRGISDVDVLGVTFKLLRCVMQCQETGALKRRRLTSKMACDAIAAPMVAPTAPAATLAAEELAAEQCAEAAVEEELQRLRGARPWRDRNATASLAATAASSAGPSRLAASVAHNEASACKSAASPMEAVGLRAVSVEKASSNDLLDAFVSSVHGSGSKQEDACDSDPDIPAAGEDACDSDPDIAAAGAAAAVASSESEGEGCANTEFVGSSSLQALKSKLSRGDQPAAKDILQLFDIEALPEDEELIPFDMSSLGHTFCKASPANAIVHLIETRGASKAAELVLGALIDVQELSKDGSENEEGMEYEEEEAEEEDDDDKDEVVDEDDEEAAESARRQWLNIEELGDASGDV